MVVRNPRLQPDFNAAIAKVGLIETTRYDVEISGLLDGKGWIPFIETEPGAFYGAGRLARLARLLQRAAYVTIAFLSGMRDGEIKHLKRGCLHIRRDARSNACRWKLLSLAFKVRWMRHTGSRRPGRSANRSRGRWRCSSGWSNRIRNTCSLPCTSAPPAPAAPARH